MSVDNVTPNQGYPLPNSANTLSHDVTRLINALLGVDSDVAARPLSSSSTYVGTTAIALNRASAAQSLTGITSIDGSAAKLTTPVTLWGQSFDGSLSITGALTSVGNITGSGAISLTTAAASNLSLTSGTTGSVTLDSGTTGAINIGTGANAKTITLGSSTGTVQLPTAVTKVGQTSLIQGGAVNITFPTVAGTLVGSGDTGTVTATMLASTTGTGSTVVLSTSPALVTPILGTPTSGNLSNCTNVPAGQLSGTIPSTVLGNSSLYVGTTSIALNRASAALGLTGISSVALPGATSGTITVQPTAVAGTNTLTLPAATDTLIGKATTDTLTNKTFDTAGAGNSFSVNGTAITAVTGTGSTVVLSTSPSLTTPTLGAASATTINKVTFTAPATGSTLTIADGKTLTASNTVTLSGTDSSTISFGAGGTIAYLGTNNAFTGANTFTNATGQVFRQAATQDGIILNGRAGGTSSYSVTFTPTTLTASRTLTLPDVAGTVVTTGDTGSVTSTMILDGTILNADVNASAAIAGTKISPDFGSQNIVTTGTGTAASFISGAGTVTANGIQVGTGTTYKPGIYSPGTDQLAISTGGTNRVHVTAAGLVGIGTTSPTAIFHAVASSSSGTSNADGIRINAAGNVAINMGVNSSLSYGWIQSANWGSGYIATAINPNGGSVGIGTNDLVSFGAQKLTVRFGSITTSNNTASGNNGELRFTGTPDGVNYNWAGIRAISDVNVNQGILAFFTSPSNVSAESSAERMRIDSSGRLLVGTSTARSNIYFGATNPTPNVQFESVTNSYSAGLSLLNYSAVGYAPILNMGLSQTNTQGTNALVGTATDFGLINFVGNDGTNFRSGAWIQATTDGTPASGSMPGRLVFSTTPSGSASPTPRMQINNDGKSGVYSTNPDVFIASSSSAAGSANYLFRGAYSATAPLNGTVSFQVTTNGNVTNTNGSYTSISDQKLKENIVDASSQWKDVKAFRIRNWNFKEETGYETHRQISPIAQELEQVSPNLVFEILDRDENGKETGEVTKGINLSVLYMKAVKALQEAMERIETLEAKVTALEGK